MNPFAPISRRDMLRTTLGGFGYLAFSGLAARAATREPLFAPKAKRVILLFMQGGVSHLDTFDYKPKLQENDGQPFPGGKGGKLLGSPWKFRQHGESGQWMSELLPHLAKRADDLCVLTGNFGRLDAHVGRFGATESKRKVLDRDAAGLAVAVRIELEAGLGGRFLGECDVCHGNTHWDWEASSAQSGRGWR